MLNCLNSCYVSLDPLSNECKFVENRWEPIWFKGSHLSLPDIAVDESRERDESAMAEGLGTVIESEIVESVDAVFWESEDISENCNVEEEHISSSEYADSCSDLNNDVHQDLLLVHDTYSWLIMIILFVTNDIPKFLHH